MNYIVYDLEFNQKHIDSAEVQASNNNSALPFEIIQIGAVKLNESFETVSTFNTLIKPAVHPCIHPYVESLTKIDNQKLSSCKGFVNVYEDFLDFIGNQEIIFCVWGITDIKELLRNIKYYSLPDSSIFKNYIDIQKYASKYLKAPRGSKIGLSTAVSLLSLPAGHMFHDALNDAYYTAEIFKKIYTEDIKPDAYIPDAPKKVRQTKEKVDTLALIKQFEKMYDREMSPEEKSIIKLAYLMGKTRQFISQHTL